MYKGDVLIISRTAWTEAPRLRHQLSRLLRDIGFTIHYVQLLYDSSSEEYYSVEMINVYTVIEKIHHQLKPFKILQDYESSRVCSILRKKIPDIYFRVIINFNYDNDFVFQLYPNTPVISVINDDFFAMAKPWMRSRVLNSLEKTLSLSQINLGVSYSLIKQMKQYSNSVDLLLPWADINYSKPVSSNKRDVLLYYGYVSRLDTKIVDQLCNSGLNIRFVGPVVGNGKAIKKKYNSYSNIEFISETNINELDLSDVICSIAPYDCTLHYVQAITASNRMFQLLARGIPLVYPNMPFLIQSPSQVITKCSTLSDYIDAIKYFEVNFNNVQPYIEKFLLDHTKDKRALYLDQLIEKLKPV